MAHTVERDFPTKKSFREAVANGERITVTHGRYNESGFWPTEREGKEYVKGPWSYHKWYAEVTMADGVEVKVK